jgi:hypothetical protein
MRTAGKLGMLALMLSACFAQQQPPPSSVTDAGLAHIEQLKARAEQRGEADRARDYAEIAHELVEVANMQFTNGDPDKGQASIKDAVAYAEKAATSAEEKGHKIKNAEITLRETARRIEEVRKTLDIDNQPPLKAAVNRLELLRKQLLQRMFGDGKK